MIRFTIARAALAGAFALSAMAPALADGPLSVYVGGQYISQDTARQTASTFGTDLAAGFDFGPKTIVPIRARFDVDDAFNVDSSGRVGVLGFGASARLTTPVYVGIGGSFYNVNVRGGSTLSASTTGVGYTVFVGNKLLSLPGIGLAIEGSYKNIPSVQGVNPSSFGLGVRASL